MNTGITHFGYRHVSAAEKTGLVNSLFSSIAAKYDLMNDIMSFGMHRHVKRRVIGLCRISSGDRVLDLAGGTGDMALYAGNITGENGQVILTDINEEMIRTAVSRIQTKKSAACRITCIRADAQFLPFEQNSFDCVIISFGLRNFTDIPAALRSVRRVLKPGGRLVILDFSRPENRLIRRMYQIYSFMLVPVIAKLITGYSGSYLYLAESIQMHPEQRRIIQMMQESGYNACRYYNIFNGIIAVHEGIRTGSLDKPEHAPAIGRRNAEK